MSCWLSEIFWRKIQTRLNINIFSEHSPLVKSLIRWQTTNFFLDQHVLRQRYKMLLILTCHFSSPHRQSESRLLLWIVCPFYVHDKRVDFIALFLKNDTFPKINVGVEKVLCANFCKFCTKWSCLYTDQNDILHLCVII